MKPVALVLTNRHPAPDPDWVWWDDAACLPFPTAWWFDDPHVNSANVSKALEICDGCSVRADCLSYANDNNEHGIWGGLTDEQRRRSRSLKRRK